MRTTPSRAVLALIITAGFAATSSSSAVFAADAPDAAASQPANAVRPEFATPFNAAQDLAKAGKGPEALAKLKEADALPNQTPYEKYLIIRVRGPAEYAAGDNAAAVTDFQAVLASDQLPAADRPPIMKALSELLYTQKDWPNAIIWMQRYFAAGGDDAQMHELLAQSQYLNKDYASAAKAYQGMVDAQYAAGHVPPEKTLRLLASAQSQVNDDVAYTKTLERLAVSYPKPDYWKELISRASRAEKMSDHLYIDLYRLKAAVYGQTADTDRLSYAELAGHVGFPGESKHVVEEGLSKKSFTGADVGEATKLDAAETRAAAQDRAQNAANESGAKSAKDGNALTNLGLADAMEGNATEGAALIGQGIDKGGLKSPDEARLHLGYAQYLAGDNANALKSFQAVGGAGGFAAIAHVWTLFLQSKMQPAAAAPVAATN